MKLLPLPLVGLLLACDVAERSDLNQYALSINLLDQLGLHSRRVLVGTDFTVHLAGVFGGGFYDLACVETSASGVLSKVGTMSYSVDAAGPGAAEFAAPDESCPYLAGFMPDRWSMIGVERDAATPVWVPTVDSTLMNSTHASPGPAGMFPDAIGRPLHRARVAVDGRFALTPALVDQSAGERAEVRWQYTDAVLIAPYEYQWDPGRVLGGRLPEGQSLAPVLSFSDDEFALPVVEAVPVNEIVALQLVPVYTRTHEPEREWGRPTSVIAIALDGEGHRIVGAPIEWSVASGYVYANEDPFANRFGDDVLQISDCGNVPPQPQWRSVRVDAKIAGQHASVDLEWLALPSDPDVNWADPSCHDDLAIDGDSGCGCFANGSSHGVAIAGLPLLVFVAIRRRCRRRE